MTIAFWCVLIAGLLPYVATVTAKAGAKFDNNHPRDWLAQQEGYRKRANAAQLNAFESFPLFAVAVIIAYLLKAPQLKVDILAVVFVGARFAYFLFYLIDLSPLRSLAWAVGLVSVISIFVAAA